MRHDPGITAARVWLCPFHCRNLFVSMLALLLLLSVVAPPAVGQCGVDACTTSFCDGSCGLGSFWLRGDVLLWWTNRGGSPALLTTSPPGTPPELAGRIGQGGTAILLTGEDLSQGIAPGFRVAMGWWFDDTATVGLEASYFRLGDGDANARATSTNTPILAHPYFNTQTNLQDAVLIAHPEFLKGSIGIDLDTSLQGFGVTWRQGLLRGCGHRTDLLVGYRLLEFDERLNIASASEFTAPRYPIVVGTTRGVFDQFDVNSRFHGAELGLAHYHQIGCLTAEASVKVALGGTRSEVDIDGQTITTMPDAGSAQFPGGLYAQQTNMGWYQHSQFAAVPEFGLNLGYDLTPNLRFLCGYQLIVWPQILRAIDQVDTRASQLPPEPPTGLRAPQFPSATSTLVVQGLHLGLQLVW
jgi:hypothetical protein